MPRLQQLATTTTTTVVKLAPALRRKILTSLKEYGSLKSQRTAVDLAMTKRRGGIEELLEEAGESKLAIDGYRASMIAPVRKSLSVKKLLALGVSADIIEKATEEVPGKPYVKVTVPGEKEDE